MINPVKPNQTIDLGIVRLSFFDDHIKVIKNTIKNPEKYQNVLPHDISIRYRFFREPFDQKMFQKTTYTMHNGKIISKTVADKHLKQYDPSKSTLIINRIKHAVANVLPEIQLELTFTVRDASGKTVSKTTTNFPDQYATPRYYAKIKKIQQNIKTIRNTK